MSLKHRSVEHWRVNVPNSQSTFSKLTVKLNNKKRINADASSAGIIK
jgi:hypothetical protein